VDRLFPEIQAEILLPGNYADTAIRQAPAEALGQIVLSAPVTTRLPYATSLARSSSSRSMLRQLSGKDGFGWKPQGLCPVEWSPCSCDFEVESVAERLNQSGFSCAERSLVIWLDVSYYLSAERFELALDEIASFSAPGSRLVLDYMDQEVIDGTTSFRGARRAADWVAKRGEPYALGFSPEDITRAVEERGYRVNDHVRVTEPARRYRPPASVWCETDDFMGIVSAERTTLGGSSGQPVDKP
jgi:leucine carboxyl methyltransferase